MRVDLSEFQPGAFAEVLDAVPYKVLKVAAAVAAKNEPSQDETDHANDVVLKTMVRAWNVKDALGEDVPIPLSATTEQIEMIDGFLVSKLFEVIIDTVAKRKPDPNSKTAS